MAWTLDDHIAGLGKQVELALDETIKHTGPALASCNHKKICRAIREAQDLLSRLTRLEATIAAQDFFSEMAKRKG